MAAFCCSSQPLYRSRLPFHLHLAMCVRFLVTKEENPKFPPEHRGFCAVLERGLLDLKVLDFFRHL